MQKFVKEISNLLSIENLSSKESVDSLVIKKHFLNFQIHKLVQLQSNLGECLRELDIVDSDLSTLNSQFTKESLKMEQDLKKEKSRLAKKLKSDASEFLENVKMKNEQDFKADQMAKVSYKLLKNSLCCPCFNDTKIYSLDLICLLEEHLLPNLPKMYHIFQ
jgi:hypothetical protein